MDIKGTYMNLEEIKKEAGLFFSNVLTSIQFVRRTMGVLLLYIIACTFIVDYAAFNLFRKLWSLALRTIPGNYLTDQNFGQLLMHPAALIIGAVISVCFCVICLWQNAGILMIIEYNRQGKPVRLLRIFYESLLQIRHAFYPKNWMIFVYTLLILPLTDPNMTMSAFSELVVPEFIMDFIIAKKLLLVIFAILFILINYFFYRFVFVQYSFVLERISFWEAAKKSRSLGVRTQLYSGITQQIVAYAAGVLYVWLPMIILMGISLVEKMLLSNSGAADAAATFIYHAVGAETCKIIGRSIVKLIVFVYMVTIFHCVYEKKDIEVNITLEDGCVKQRGKIRSFRGWVYAGAVVLYLLYALLTGGIICVANAAPEELSDLIVTTQIAAHKGYSSKAPENTMDAFRLAVESDSVSYIELDVRSTRDGIPVVIHNESLYEAAGEDISIYDVDFSKLNDMAAPYSFGEEYPYARVPSLEEVLSTYPDEKRYIIEIKYSDRTPELPGQVAHLMEKYGLVEDSVVHSGSYEALEKVKAVNPDITCGYIVAVSLGGFYDLECADFFSLEHDFATERVVQNIHDRGKKVFVWTVNEQHSMEEGRYSMIDVVITDYPDECEAVINSDANLFIRMLDSVGDEVGLDGFDALSDKNGHASDGDY